MKSIFVVSYDTFNGGFGVFGVWYPSALDAAKVICQHTGDGDPELIAEIRSYDSEFGSYWINELEEIR